MIGGLCFVFEVAMLLLTCIMIPTTQGAKQKKLHHSKLNNRCCENAEKKTIEVKQSFFSSAISDISAYIQLVDTKVSIIMAAVVAIIMGGVACYELIENLISLVKPCSWQGVALIISTTALVVSIAGVFVFGILTIRSHSSKIGYNSKWFLPQSTNESKTFTCSFRFHEL